MRVCMSVSVSVSLWLKPSGSACACAHILVRVRVPACAQACLGSGITVNIVQPGHIATAAELQMGLTPTQVKLQGQRIPAGRMGRGEDIAAAVRPDVMFAG
jgi:3-oxoacyl-[acyl-carrier protein] reductase